ncbi:MAG: exosortase/archaeosortase family protein [Verrucomicrobiae bacterium]
MTRPARSISLVVAGVVSISLLAMLLSVPYSFGVVTVPFSIGSFLWSIWTTNPDMQHGFLVLPAIAYLIYEKRKEIAEVYEAGNALPGMLVLACGLFLFWAGSQADVTSIGLLSLMVVVVGLVWFFFGWRMLLLLSFPLGFFIFAIPIPGLDTMVAFPLRMIMSQTAVSLLDLFGVDVIRQGTGILSAPDPLLGLPAGKRFSVDVADPCSGIRSLFALLMVSALYAHFTLQTWWEKWILFLCAIPLAVAGNLARILTLTLATVAFGSEFAIGKNALTEPSWFHMAAGYLVFAVALGGMIGVAWLLTNRRNLKSTCATLLRAVKQKSLPAARDSSPSHNPASSAPIQNPTSNIPPRPRRPESPY